MSERERAFAQRGKDRPERLTRGDIAVESVRKAHYLHRWQTEERAIFSRRTNGPKNGNAATIGRTKKRNAKRKRQKARRRDRSADGAPARPTLGRFSVMRAWCSLKEVLLALLESLSEMSALLQGVLLYMSTFIVLVGVGLLWDVWRHKDSFEIAARSPVLLCLAGTAHVALVFLQMIARVRAVCQKTAGSADGKFQGQRLIVSWTSYEPVSLYIIHACCIRSMKLPCDHGSHV